MHPDYPKQETAGAEVDRAVGAAVDRYEVVLDAQWGDADCVVERCPKSSKSLPGMPSDRAEFTKQERFNLERKAHYLSREPVSSTDLYSVVKTDAGVEAIVYVTVAKCYGSEVIWATDPHRMMLAPSGGCDPHQGGVSEISRDVLPAVLRPEGAGTGLLVTPTFCMMDDNG